MSCKVSIIMGIYNCAPTLTEAIDSIANQIYHDWELIMCDDGSTDNTYDIAVKYIQEHPEYRIRLLKHGVNKGLNQTLNDCLSEASGEYIARMDADDISLPDRLKKEVDFLDSNPRYAVVSCPMIYFDENGEWGRGSCIKEPEKGDFVAGTPFCHAPCMVRAEAFRAVGGYTVDKRLLRVEDYHLWIKIYEQGYRGYNLDEHLYKMRDDRSAAGRRRYKYRINEAYVRMLAVSKLNLNKVNYIFMLRPLIVGLLPNKVYEILHRRRVDS